MANEVNHIEYLMAELFSAINNVQEYLKKNHLHNQITKTIINLLLKDHYSLEKYLKEKGEIYNGGNENS